MNEIVWTRVSGRPDPVSITIGGEPPTVVYRAVMVTRSWEFDAFGRTEDEARTALVAGLQRHARQYGLRVDPGLLPRPRSDDWYWLEDITVYVMRIGVAYRDAEELA